MEKLGLNEIRERYLSFFESKGHLRLPSFPLVPQNDDSLLLINAGMAPLKPYFVGKEIPPRNRVTTCQKCIRTPDIERVGKTARHGTFFEMLGNFSFGDYFKHEATAWAWEFITEDLKLPKDKLWVTVYEDDDEAIDIWVNEVGVERERIKRMGKEDNFWEIGTGPCGPCSEIYFDRGEKAGCGRPDCAVGCDCDRFVEFWNLVFTQFDKDEDGNYNRLAKPNIDTGMGLERIAAIMQGVQNLFEVDTVRNIMLEISKLAGVNYGENEKSDVSLRVITDHIRSTTFLVCDGVGPSNEGRGYVLRRLLRRAARHGRLLGIKGNFLYNIADTVINESKDAYPQLEAKRDYIKKVIQIEEARFSETIDSGLSILEEYIAALEEKGEKLLAGSDAFRLYDTYGFPIDLTAEILTEKGLDVDMDAFAACMNEQKNRSRENRNVGEEAAWSEDVYMQIGKEVSSEFVGYENESAEGKVIAIVKDNAIAQSLADGENGVVILDKTAIYGESGGQKGDTGFITADGVKLVVNDAKKLGDGKILHFVYVEEGSINVGDTVTSTYDKERRMNTARNHSATHLLQKALQEVVGSHIEQAGSFVDDKRLRFDFTHFEAISSEDLKKVEAKVNEAIMASYDIDVKVMPIDEAKKMGAMALFGEKYGETVRVVNMGGYSIEFCGGTHLKNTAQAGLFKLLSEGGVAAGVRRIEATTGRGVLEYIAEKDAIIAETAEVLKTNPAEIVNKAESITGELKAIQKSLEEVKAKMASAAANDLLTSIKHVGEVDVLTAQLSGVSADELKMLTDKMKEKCECGVAVLASVDADKITFVAAATKKAVSMGVHAGNIIKEITKVTDGRGGGKPDMAQGGGKLVNKVDDALAMVDDLVIAQCGGNK
ncbi:MAG: alanine--tRNA ligase [Clostridia bacterium]|nr:alanine--tRNA ligase [Clostridia bacterium]